MKELFFYFVRLSNGMLVMKYKSLVRDTCHKMTLFLRFALKYPRAKRRNGKKIPRLANC